MKLLSSHIICFFLLFACGNLEAQEKKGLRVTGNLQTHIRYYSATKNFGSRPPLVATFYATPTIYWNKWRIPTRLSIGNYQTQYRSYNRYGIAPENGKVRLFLGHNTLEWNPLVLQNRPVFGAGFELLPGKLRLGVFAGIINRSSSQDTFQKRVFIPAYARNMVSWQLGYGDQQNHILFTWLLGSDNKKSLDSAAATGISAASNSVMGVSVAKKIGRFNFNADGGLSSFTRDLNENGKELGNFSVAKLPGILLQTNASTTFNAAVLANATYTPLKKWPGTKLLALFERIEPHYQSMGLYFLVNDIQRIRGGIRHSSQNGQFTVNIQGGTERNDILNTQYFRNKRAIGSVLITYRYHNNWNSSLSVQNYTVKLLADGITLQDSLVINQLNRSYVLGLSGKPNPANKGMLTISTGFQGGSNVISGTTSKNLGHTFLMGKWNPGSDTGRWHLAPGFGFHRYASSAFNTTRYLPNVGLIRNARKSGIQLETGIMVTFFGGKYSNTAWRNYLTAMLHAADKHTLQLGLLLQQNLQAGASFREFQVDLRYGIRL